MALLTAIPASGQFARDPTWCTALISDHMSPLHRNCEASECILRIADAGPLFLGRDEQLFRMILAWRPFCASRMETGMQTRLSAFSILIYGHALW